jgi:hypothetical protein
MLFLNSWMVSVVPYYVTTHLPAVQSIDTQGKLKLNLHCLSVSELLEYMRKAPFYTRPQRSQSGTISGFSHSIYNRCLYETGTKIT